MSAIDRFKRKTSHKPTYHVILIVCEGERTEPDYFRSFVLPKNVIDIQGTGANTHSLVQQAIDLRNEGAYEEVWCVFDRDSFPPENVAKAFQLASDNNIQIAFSNECFELWYLLHYVYLDTAITRARYRRMLTEQLGRQYQKNDADMYAGILDSQSVAIKRAKRLAKEFPLEPGKECNSKPMTTVYELVERLNKLAKKHRERYG